MASKQWTPKNLKFKCQGSGNCCVSRGEYGFVFLTLTDRKMMAKELGISLKRFEKQYCQVTGGNYHLIEDENRTNCIFLEDNKCEVYKARPTQCRTWPFWPEVMNAKDWKSDVEKFCPGVGKGKTWTPPEMKKILAEQEISNKELDEEAHRLLNK